MTEYAGRVISFKNSEDFRIIGDTVLYGELRLGIESGFINLPEDSNLLYSYLPELAQHSILKETQDIFEALISKEKRSVV